MDRIRALTRTPLALVAVAVVAIAGIAVGAFLFLSGDSDSPDDAEPGDRTSLLVSLDALPGDGWTSEDVTLQQASTAGVELVSSAPSSPECESVRVLERALAGADAAFVSGDTRTAERRDGDNLIATLSHSRLTFADAASVDATIAEMDTAVASPDFAACLERAAAESGLLVEVETTQREATPPASGSAHAFAYTIADGDSEERMVQHLYWWREDTTLVALVIATWGDEADVAAMLASATGAKR